MSLEDDVAQFLMRYPVDQVAEGKLRSLPEPSLRRVLTDFQAQPEANGDYSRRLMGFLKGFHGSGVGFGAPSRSSSAPEVAFNPVTSARSLGELDMPAPSAESLELFKLKYPMDDSAWDYLSNAPPPVQERVLNTFRPPDTVEGDYSKIVTRHITFCLRKYKEETGGGEYPQSVPCVSLEAARAAIMGDSGAGGRVITPDNLEHFRIKYPMDERAFEYLSSSPHDVQERVLATFKVDKIQDDYSRAVTAHVRFCVRRFQESTGAVELPGGPAGAKTLQQIAQFKEQYPIDDRALDYLLQSSLQVKNRVLTEFRPAQLAEGGDYSRAVTAFVRRCREDDRTRQPDILASSSFDRSGGARRGERYPSRRYSRSPSPPRRGFGGTSSALSSIASLGLNASQQAQAAELLDNAMRLAGAVEQVIKRPRMSPAPASRSFGGGRPSFRR